MFSFKIPTFWHTLKKPFNGKGKAITVVQCLIHGKLAKPYAIPFAVVTNGNDVHILETASGKVIGRGLESIPSRVDMARQFRILSLIMLQKIDWKRKNEYFLCMRR